MKFGAILKLKPQNGSKRNGKNIWVILGFECISSHVVLSLSQQFEAILGYISYLPILRNDFYEFLGMICFVATGRLFKTPAQVFLHFCKTKKYFFFTYSVRYFSVVDIAEPFGTASSSSIPGLCVFF